MNITIIESWRRCCFRCLTRSVLVAAVLAMSVPAATQALAQEPASAFGVRWPAEEVEPLATELALELRVAISPPVVVGQSDAGRRQFIPITGGYFVGDGIRGTVLPGGADWQLLRPDGVLEIVAIYAIQTDDGATIMVDNRGIGVPPAADDPSGVRYLRTVPKFHAPEGKYDWLNESIFVGSITPAPEGDAVVIRAFKVL